MDDLNGIDGGLLLLRVVVGLTMAAHGWWKIFKGGRLPGTARWFSSMGMRPGEVHARLAAFTELGSGVLLALGFLTPFAGAAFVGLMLVAGWTVHRPKGFFIVQSGWEYNLVLAVVGAALATTGAGRLSLDWAIWDEGAPWGLDGWPGFLIAAGGGLAAGAAQLAAFWRPPKPA